MILKFCLKLKELLFKVLSSLSKATLKFETEIGYYKTRTEIEAQKKKKYSQFLIENEHNMVSSVH